MSEDVAELQDENPQGETPEITGEDVDEESSPQPEENSAEPEKPKAKGVQKRIDELTANWREQERINEQLRQQNMELQRALIPKEEKPAEVSAPQVKPTVEDFDSYDGYLEALADWQADRKLEAWKQEQEQVRVQQETAQAQQNFHSTALSYAAEAGLEDYEQVAFNEYLPVSEAMAEVLNASPTGPQMLYHLGKNPQESQRIAQLSPVQAALELGRLEVKLASPQPKTTTQAPDPVQPVQSSGGPATTDPDRMTADEWRVWRENQLRQQ